MASLFAVKLIFYSLPVLPYRRGSVVRHYLIIKRAVWQW